MFLEDLPHSALILSCKGLYGVLQLVGLSADTVEELVEDVGEGLPVGLEVRYLGGNAGELVLHVINLPVFLSHERLHAIESVLLDPQSLFQIPDLLLQVSSPFFRHGVNGLVQSHVLRLQVVDVHVHHLDILVVLDLRFVEFLAQLDDLP